MKEKTIRSYRIFLQGFLGLYFGFQCVSGILYWSGNVTREQKFDTASDLGKIVAALPALPVHLIQTGLVFAAAYYLFRRFRGRRRSLFYALSAVTVPFVMQVCLCETEHAAALAAILCMTAVTLDCHTHKEQEIGRPQMLLFCVGLIVLLFCGAAYSCAAALLCGVCLIIEERKHRRKKGVRSLCLILTLLLCVVLVCYGSYRQNRANPDRMQITWQSVLMKRLAYPGLEGALSEGIPEELSELFDSGDINTYRLYPYLLDTELESVLAKAVGQERIQEIYLALAWHGLDCGIKVDFRMILEDLASYLFPGLMYPFYSNGTILSEFGWSFQQFVAGTPYLAEIYLYGSLLGYAAGLVLALVYGLLSRLMFWRISRPAGGGMGAGAQVQSFRLLILLWFGLSVVFTMRGAAVYNYKYAAYQAILALMPFPALLTRTESSKAAGGEKTGLETDIIG